MFISKKVMFVHLPKSSQTRKNGNVIVDIIWFLALQAKFLFFAFNRLIFLLLQINM